MKTFTRLIDGGTAFERQLLGSARRDQAPETSRTRVAASIGLAAAPASVPGASVPREPARGLEHPVAGGELAASAFGASAKPLLFTLLGCLGALALASWALRGTAPPPARALAPVELAAPGVGAAAPSAAAAPDDGDSAPSAALATANGVLSPRVPSTKGAPRPPIVTTRVAPHNATGSVPSGGNDLIEEVRQLDRARSALSAARPEEALGLLGSYARRFPRGQLQLEADVVRARALFAAGQYTTARSLAERLLAEPGAERYRADLVALLATPPLSR